MWFYIFFQKIQKYIKEKEKSLLTGLLWILPKDCALKPTNVHVCIYFQGIKRKYITLYTLLILATHYHNMGI